MWRQALALVRANRGEHAEAERLAREAVRFARMTDSPHLQANALSDLADVLDAAGRGTEAADTLRQAHQLYDRKGILPLARRVRERLAMLETATASD